jgi:hypothetical protein
MFSGGDVSPPARQREIHAVNLSLSGAPLSWVHPMSGQLQVSTSVWGHPQRSVEHLSSHICPGIRRSDNVSIPVFLTFPCPRERRAAEGRGEVTAFSLLLRT